MAKRVRAVVRALGLADDPETIRLEFVDEAGRSVFLDMPLEGLPPFAELLTRAYRLQSGSEPRAV